MPTSLRVTIRHRDLVQYRYLLCIQPSATKAEANRTAAGDSGTATRSAVNIRLATNMPAGSRVPGEPDAELLKKKLVIFIPLKKAVGTSVGSGGSGGVICAVPTVRQCVRLK